MLKLIFDSPPATALAGALLLFGSVACQGPGQEAPPTTNRVYATMLNGMLKKSVPFVSVEQVEKQPPAVLLDSRAPREYAVSHLRGARWVGYEDFSLARVRDLPKDTPIVVYCSVGYRSEKVGEQLQRAGYTQVRNLYGGLFEWMNAGNLPVGKGNAPTERVHAFSRAWGIWLQRGQKVYQ